MTDRLAISGLALTIAGSLLPWISISTGFDSTITAYVKGDSYQLLTFGSVALLLHLIPRVSVTVRYIASISVGLGGTLLSIGDARVIKFFAFDNPTLNAHTRIGIWFCLIGGVITTFAGLISRHAPRSG